MGRRKIEIQPLADDRNRTVTFLKRKAGLFKKAHELAVLCQVDLAVIILGNNNRLYEFSSVDTKELISVCSKLKPHESKSPENYGNYRKRKYLHQNYIPTNSNGTMKKLNDPLGDEIDVNESDFEYDESDSPEPTSKKRKVELNTNPPTQQHQQQRILNFDSGNNIQTTTNVPQYGPAFSNPKMPQFQDLVQQSNHRPVLRVQIPVNSIDREESNIKGNLENKSVNNGGPIDGKLDSEKTLTAVDVSQSAEVKPSISTNVGGVTQNTHINGDIKLKVESKNPIVMGTINPNLPIDTSKYVSSNSFRSPGDSRKPALPLPVHTKSQTSSPSNPNAPQLPMAFFTSISQSSPSSLYANQPSRAFHTPVINQMFNTGNYHPPNQQEMPGSALPSRYLHDMFPSPSNFYASQDWPSGSVLTPFHQTSAPFLTPIAPSGVTGGINTGGGGGSGGGGGGGGSSFPPIPQGQSQTTPATEASQATGGGVSVDRKNSK